MEIHHRGRMLQDSLRIILRRRWAILAVFICLVGLVALKTYTATPVYKATVQILVERKTPGHLDQRDSLYSPEYYYGEEFYQTQYKLLESRALAKKVADTMQLKNHPYYSQIFRDLPATADEVMKQRAEESLVSAVAGGVQISPIRQSSLIDVSFSHPDPQFAANLVNTLARCYIEQSLELHTAASQEEAEWLKKKLSESRAKLEASEEKLNRYKRDNGIVVTEDKESITAQKLEQLNKDLVAAQTHRMEVETRFNAVSQGKPIAQVLDNPLIQQLKTQEAKILAEQSELSRRFGPEHPRILQLSNELAATRGKVAAETNQVVQAIKNEYQMAKAQEDNLKAALDAQKADTQDMSDKNVRYRVLLRDVETNRALYENMLRSLKTTNATENLPVTNIRIVYPAAVPTAPASPNKPRNLLLASLFGVILGIGVAFTLETLDTTLKTPEEVEKLLEIPNLAMIPHVEWPANNPAQEAPELMVHANNQPMASEKYRVLRTSILLSSAGHAPRVLLITSTLATEGKTLTAVNLATAMAKAEPNVLLVDSDLRRPSLHQLFQVPIEPGLSNFLVGEIDEIPALATMIPNLFFVPCGSIPPDPSELLGSERMQEFLSRARERFGRIILDSPPLLSVTDPAILANQVEGVVLVVKADLVPREGGSGGPG